MFFVPSEDEHQREYVALSDKRPELVLGSVRASYSLRLGSKAVSTLASWVSEPSEVDVRLSDYRPPGLPGYKLKGCPPHQGRRTSTNRAYNDLHLCAVTT
ncbi:hypothetical protein K443DRAFT_462960 [Laccaria amethystina LaAM-08-1]|uniref:Uncharacterized protein n=1 Tax=Laccaria amethystina LaAM-08-1 TaxID=1095629 RepID=A0A0C9WNK9_9AGAR|nr:hypothetical protein K443DRAFT_462960 [Laccaria amethystina LaAM-08-1]